MREFLYNFWREQDGQDVMEYSLFLCFVALICTGFLGIFHTSIASVWQSANSTVHQAASTASGN